MNQILFLLIIATQGLQKIIQQNLVIFRVMLQKIQQQLLFLLRHFLSFSQNSFWTRQN